MTISKLHAGLIVLPLVLVGAAAFFAVRTDIAIDLTPAGLEVYRYRQDTVLAATELARRTPLFIPQEVRDPLETFRSEPVVTEAAQPLPVFEVTFILVGEDDRVAVINGMIVREGDTVNTMKVAKIEKGKVALTAEGVMKWLTVEEQ